MQNKNNIENTFLYVNPISTICSLRKPKFVCRSMCIKILVNWKDFFLLEILFYFKLDAVPKWRQLCMNKFEKRTLNKNTRNPL